jgi:hypothetical protein
MPQPTSSQVHYNRLLTNMSVAYLQDPSKFAAFRMFPGVNVENKSNYFAIYSKADFLRDEMEVRAPATESAGTGWSLDKGQYLVQRYAIHVDVDDDTLGNQDAPLSVENDTALFLSQKTFIKAEVTWATKFFTTSTWTGGIKASGSAGDLVAGTDFTAWDDATSDPIGDVTKQMANIESVTGLLPNKLAISRQGWNALKNHPDIVDRVKYTSAEAVQTAVVARLFDLDEIVIAAGVRNTAAKGLAGSYSYVVGKHALLAYVPATASLRQPSAGYTFRWTGMPGSIDGAAVSSFAMPSIKATRHEIEYNFDMRQVCADVGAFFQNVVS